MTANICTYAVRCTCIQHTKAIHDKRANIAIHFGGCNFQLRKHLMKIRFNSGKLICIIINVFSQIESIIEEHIKSHRWLFCTFELILLFNCVEIQLNMALMRLCDTDISKNLEP